VASRRATGADVPPVRARTVDVSENEAPGLTAREPAAPGNRYALAMPFGIGIWELLILLLVLLLVFGTKRLPEMGRQLGKGMREFKDSVTGDSKDDDDVPVA